MKILKILFVISFVFATQTVLARDWAKYTSANFTIYSDENDKKVTRLLNDFEVFRQIAMVQLGLPREQPENQRLTIIMYSKAREFRKTGVKSNIAGFFVNLDIGPRMVVGPGRGSLSSREILFHEYVHHLFSEHSVNNYPRWYSEGMADVLSTARIYSDKVTVGEIPESRKNIIVNLGILPIQDLIDIRSRSENSNNYEARFYATAWLLTHYLQINTFYENNYLGDQLKDYLIRFHNGDDPHEAFTTAFETTPREIKRDIERYVGKRRIPGIAWSRPEMEIEVLKQEVSTNELNYQLGDLVWSMGEEDNALEYLDQIQEPGAFYAESLSLRAILNNHKEDAESIALAKTLSEQAMQYSAENSIVNSELAHYALDVYQREKAKGVNNETLLLQIREYAEKAVELDNKNINGFRYLAAISKVENKVNEGLKALIAGSELFPGSAFFKVEIIKLLMENKRADLARPFVMNLVSAVHDAAIRETLTTLLGQIDRDEVDYGLIENL